jgi:hypothetical protein
MLKKFWEMSKRLDAKRHRYEAARFSGPDNNQERDIKEGNQNENDNSTNEKPGNADS